MALVSRLVFPETLEDMEKAAAARMTEGEALVSQGFWDAGIYLLGYTAEMLLKTSYCRIDPTLTSMTPVQSVFGIAEQQWRNLFNTRPPRQYGHNLLFWERVIHQQRLAHHRPPLTSSVSMLLSHCVSLVDANWTVEMRYQPRKALEQEALAVRLGVRWLHSNHRDLWS